MQTRLERVADGYRLTGRKWLVGGGKRASAFYVAARTGRAGPGAFTGVLIDAPHEHDTSFCVHPSTPAGGMRGIDFNDVEWNEFSVTADSLLGREGQGLETAFKAQQIVRLLSVAGNLGCADTGLRAAIAFLAGRRVRGQALIDAPSVRSQLGVACAGLLVLDICARIAGRGIHALPTHFANWSNVIKWLGFTISEDVLTRAAGLLGARSVLAGGHFGGIFEKVRRDNLVIRFVDTSPYGVLKGVAAHLQALSTVGPDQLVARESASREMLRCVFRSDHALPEFAPGSLDLFAKGADPVMAAFLRNSASMQGAAAKPLAGAIRQTDEGIRKLLSRTQELLKEDPARFGASAENLRMAESYCRLHGAAVCAMFWCHRGVEDAVIAAAVNYLLDTPDSVANEAAIEFVMQGYGAGQLLSTQPVEIAG